MKRAAVFAYGVASYLVFFATFLYAFGFVSNVLVPKSIDSGAEVPFLQALLTNAALLSVFALQHSIMARQWFKPALTRWIPEPAERSTYVLFSSLALIAVFYYWQPMGGVVWSVENPTAVLAIQALAIGGWLLVLVSTFLINHFDLFGLRQVYLYLTGRPYTPLKFRTPAFYRHVRHPLYLGWLFAFWAAPVMTSAHLFFAVMTTAYILTAIQFEERDLLRIHGEKYRKYRADVPMIVPVRIGRAQDANAKGQRVTAGA